MPAKKGASPVTSSETARRSGLLLVASAVGSLLALSSAPDARHRLQIRRHAAQQATAVFRLEICRKRSGRSALRPQRGCGKTAAEEVAAEDLRVIGSSISAIISMRTPALSISLSTRTPSQSKITARMKQVMGVGSERKRAQTYSRCQEHGSDSATCLSASARTHDLCITRHDGHCARGSEFRNGICLFCSDQNERCKGSSCARP